MNTKTILLSCLALTFLLSNTHAQSTKKVVPQLCHTDEVMLDYYNTHPEAKKEADDFENYVVEFTKNLSQQRTSANCYVIPVVFHVYGTTQGGYPVNLNIIQGALTNWVNKDFQGLNTDYNSVHSSFLAIRDKMPDVIFALAQKDPNGNATTGVVNHPVASGYGNGSGYDNLIAADAWDNYKYMNVYIMNDLYNNGVTNNSGVAWYPSTTMSNANTARVVYNGAYVGVNCNSWQPEFASVLTHEFGHWLNLIHTFNGGCVAPNDNVSDTPMCDYNGVQYTCHTTGAANNPLNCNNQLINAENYMDYSGADGCYKMFTQGQVTRMYAALQLPSRQPLWQLSNLTATGLANLCASGIKTNTEILHVVTYPNPSEGKFILSLSALRDLEVKIVVTDVMGRIIYSKQETFLAGDTETEIDLNKETAGVYLMTVSGKEFTKTMNLMKQ